MDNRLLGVDEKNQGFSSYLYNRHNLKDHCVIGQHDLFARLRIYMFIIFFSLPIIFAILLPSLTVINYIRIRKQMIKEESSALYYVWAVVIVSIPLNCFFLGRNAPVAMSGVQENTANADVKWYYFLSFFVIMAYPILNYLIAIVAAVYSRMIKVILQNPIPCPIRCCSHKYSGLIAFTLGIATTTFAIQWMCPHSLYIILALIVSPIHTCSFLSLYAAGLLCLVVLIAIFLKAVHVRCRGILLAFIGVVMFVLLIIFITAFMEVMILFGDYNNTGGVLSIIGSIAETSVLTALAYAGNTTLKSFGSKQRDLTNQENGPDVRPDKNVPRKRNTSSASNS